MQTKIVKSMNGTYFIEVWKNNQWQIFSEHHFKADAELIEFLIPHDKNGSMIKTTMDEINKAIKELNLTAANRLL